MPDYVYTLMIIGAALGLLGVDRLRRRSQVSTPRAADIPRSAQPLPLPAAPPAPAPLPARDLPTPHAVIVHFALSNDTFGSEADRVLLEALEDQLHEALANGDLGYVDGHDVGQGEAGVYLYGPHADALFDAIEPTVRRATRGKKVWVMKCYGSADDARTDRVELSSGGPPN
ncbi:MAG: hypothetical protein U0414_00075 [Polyangiaceae bacterium]